MNPGTRTAALLALLSCDPNPVVAPPALACGIQCSSNLECSHDLLGRCKYCNFGQCKSTRPEGPVPDAGVDASVDTSTR